MRSICNPLEEAGPEGGAAVHGHMPWPHGGPHPFPTACSRESAKLTLGAGRPQARLRLSPASHLVPPGRASGGDDHPRAAWQRPGRWDGAWLVGGPALGLSVRRAIRRLISTLVWV